jgi:hypothetical protein
VLPVIARAPWAGTRQEHLQYCKRSMVSSNGKQLGGRCTSTATTASAAADCCCYCCCRSAHTLDMSLLPAAAAHCCCCAVIALALISNLLDHLHHYYDQHINASASHACCAPVLMNSSPSCRSVLRACSDPSTDSCCAHTNSSASPAGYSDTYVITCR